MMELDRILEELLDDTAGKDGLLVGADGAGHPDTTTVTVSSGSDASSAGTIASDNE